ncbi:Lrp/AsnC ligand binding domain-containing protein [Amycolatopsis sp. FBCC-B4732]|uniref:Lrp/AsnC ligand binding domain-containing protein n=1 Tax=Amycolatopsis sp. FBCC-B4732 TaxID=3079339 RepID=UPI001FF56114|nr:Lrp/AsnC ligand binding domain-containing protein [Amycolatopsis sp. FBCC-B4732]UOX89737.1 Lrp/AsnC ligand binding domain-containing protein [Amycolatopsis sp. FBCC-B4732]
MRSPVAASSSSNGRPACPLASHPETSFAVATTGTTNLTAMVNCRDGGDLYRYLTGRVAGIRGVQTLESAPVIRTVKRAGTPLRRPAGRP